MLLPVAEITVLGQNLLKFSKSGCMVLPSATARTTLTAVMLAGDGHGDVASNNKVLVFPVFIDCEKSVTLVRRGVPGVGIRV